MSAGQQDAFACCTNNSALSSGESAHQASPLREAASKAWAALSATASPSFSPPCSSGSPFYGAPERTNPPLPEQPSFSASAFPSFPCSFQPSTSTFDSPAPPLSTSGVPPCASLKLEALPPPPFPSCIPYTATPPAASAPAALAPEAPSPAPYPAPCPAFAAAPAPYPTFAPPMPATVPSPQYPVPPAAAPLSPTPAAVSVPLGAVPPPPFPSCFPYTATPPAASAPAALAPALHPLFAPPMPATVTSPQYPVPPAAAPLSPTPAAVSPTFEVRPQLPGSPPPITTMPSPPPPSFSHASLPAIVPLHDCIGCTAPCVPRSRVVGEPYRMGLKLASPPAMPEPTPCDDPQLRLRIAELEDQLRACQEGRAALQAELEAARLMMGRMEEELRTMRARWDAHLKAQSRTSTTETYKVKTFEMAAKLAVMDGTDDGLYNDLPIEVEGLGLYRDLVAKGWKVDPALLTRSASSTQQRVSSLTGGAGGSITTSSKETYKVQTFEIAEKLAKMDGTDDGLYNGLPIEVIGLGLFRDLVKQGYKSTATTATSSSGARASSSTTTTETYKVSSMELAEKLSKMDGTDDGLHNGLPIEVIGMGLYRDLRGSYKATATAGGGATRTSTTTTTETYKVQSMEVAEKLSKMDGTDDGLYNGLPIEVAGLGLFRDLRARTAL